MNKIFPFLAAVVLCGCATGSTTLTGTARPQLAPEAVKIFAEAPSDKYETIGLVSGYDGGASWTFQGGREKATRQMQQRAAKIGANGVIIKSGGFDAWTGTQVEGIAIFVLPKEQ